MAIVFVGGVHGVGKSTHCQYISERTGLQWFMASALIKAEMQSAIAVGSKVVVDPIGNQELLLRGVRNCMSPGQGRALLDGHFTLLNAGGETVAIDIDVFVRLGLERIIVIRDEAAAICDRLRERDGQDWSISIISVHQDAEINQAHAVATKLRIPVLLIDAFDANGLEKAVEVLVA
jgi:adenylate kinase